MYCAFGTPVSIGMTASLPYTKENGVAHVEVCAVVLYDHKTPRSSSAYLPLNFSHLFLSLLTMVLFVGLLVL